MFPLRVGEISHAPDLLQIRLRSKHLFVSDIYEIGSSDSGGYAVSKQGLYCRLTMKLMIPFRSGLKAAPPCRLRLIVSYPRVGLNLVPSQARPNLFGD